MKKFTSYVLRDIPAPLWRAARMRAIKEGRTMRAVLIGLISAWVRS